MRAVVFATAEFYGTCKRFNYISGGIKVRMDGK